MIDRYTQLVLTVIAIALSINAIGNVVSPAGAQGPTCGDTRINACYVRVVQ